MSEEKEALQVFKSIYECDFESICKFNQSNRIVFILHASFCISFISNHSLYPMFECTVKPVYKDPHRDPKLMALTVAGR